MKISSKILFAAALALSGSVAAIETATAMPLTQPAQITAAAPVQDIGWRCGPGWHVNPWGRCVPNRRWRRW
jgi:hypothetical protein